MFKVLITMILILILTTSIYSQAEAKGGGFRGGSFGGGKSFSSNSVPLGTGPGKMFTTSPSGKINSQESPQLGSKQTASSSSSSSSGSNNPQNNFKPQSSQSQFQQQPRSNFFGGGFGGGGLGGFGNMIMASIMGNFIGQALFGWMLPHPVPVAAPAPTQSSSGTAANNGTSDNPTRK